MSKKKYNEMIVSQKDRHNGRFLNIYECPRGHQILTIDLHCGDTPRFMACHACPEPKKKTIYYRPIMMESRKYPEYIQTKDNKVNAQCEFYRPTYSDFLKMEDGPLKHYVINGGLLVRIKGEKEPMKWV